MAKKERQPYSINRFFAFVTYFPIIHFVLLAVVTAVLTVIYINTQNIAFIIAYGIFALVMLILYIGYSLYSNHQFQNVFVKSLFEVTKQNFESISNSDNALINYPKSHYDEFKTLNHQVDTLKKELDQATIIAGTKGFENIPFDYFDKENEIISFDSFKINLEPIIFASQNYRNVLIELYYELNNETLTKKEIDYLFKLFKMQFAEYKNSLYIFRKDDNSLFLFLPRIDSLSKIREQIETMTRSATITKRTAEGVTNLTAHFAVVCYPFSDVNELLPDLRYVKRQGEDIKFYLPNRLNTLQSSTILKNSMNLNTMSKMLAPLLNLNLSLENSKNNFKEVERVLEEMRAYFNLDYAGIISYDDVKLSYYMLFQSHDKNVAPLSRDGNLEKEFVYAMDQAKDENNSYYFAFRNHSNNALGRHLDRVGLESGFFYVLKDGDLAVGAIYFFNAHKRFAIDSYIQESLVVFCDKIAAILLANRRDKEVESSFNEIDAILKIANYNTYRVSHKDYTLLRTSSSMKSIFPHATLGEKCYKALYGLEKPCPDCPLISGNKKANHIGKNNYETSLILSERNSNYHVMTLKALYNEESTSRYHPELLVNTYTSLVEDMNNVYAVSGRGYLLILRVDNLTELVAYYGTEGYLSIIRDFVRRIKKLHNGLENIYHMNNQALALLYTEYGQTDILDECEKIFALTVKEQNSDIDYQLRLTYLPVSYPRTFPNATAFLKQAEVFLNKGKYELNKDFIYFDESNYSRSANKDVFMLSVIDSAFGNKTFGVNLQPMVSAKDKRIIGAELLLRIVDEYRNTTFRADELVNVAAKHDKIGVISHALLDYIAALYNQYGANIFSMLGFNHLSINTDYSFFTDPNFYNDIREYIKMIKLPNNFLVFEIPESDISRHIHDFKDITRQLNALHIITICDQYTGRFIGVEALKNVGFNGVKISRNIINHIDSNNQRLADVRTLLTSIKELGLLVTVVGVENIDQYHLLKEINDSMLMQGFYFHRPLEKQALIETIRATNVVVNKKD